MRSTKIAYQEIWRINSRLSSIQLTYVYSSKICTSVSICMEPKLRLYWVPNLKDLQFSHCCGNQSVAFKLTFLINGKYTLNWNCNMICDLWFVFFLWTWSEVQKTTMWMTCVCLRPLSHLSQNIYPIPLRKHFIFDKRL